MAAFFQGYANFLYFHISANANFSYFNIIGVIKIGFILLLKCGEGLVFHAALSTSSIVHTHLIFTTEFEIRLNTKNVFREVNSSNVCMRKSLTRAFLTTCNGYSSGTQNTR